MSVEDLKNEYAKTKTEAQDYRLMVEKGMFTGDDIQDIQSFLRKVD